VLTELALVAQLNIDCQVSFRPASTFPNSLELVFACPYCLLLVFLDESQYSTEALSAKPPANRYFGLEAAAPEEPGGGFGGFF
jgi:hypothetical protein